MSTAALSITGLHKSFGSSPIIRNLGLAPLIVDVVMRVIGQIGAMGVSVVLVEQKLTFALNVARRVLVMGHGSIVFAGDTDAFKADTAVQERWLGVS